MRDIPDETNDQMHSSSVFKKMWNYFSHDGFGRSKDNQLIYQSARNELIASGLTDFQLERNESRHISYLLQKNEHIQAAVRGYVEGAGAAMLFATNERLIYLQEDLSYTDFEEFSYSTIKSVSINRNSTIVSCVSLVTIYKSFRLDFVNARQADKFERFVSSRISHDGASYPLSRKGVAFGNSKA